VGIDRTFSNIHHFLFMKMDVAQMYLQFSAAGQWEGFQSAAEKRQNSQIPRVEFSREKERDSPLVRLRQSRKGKPRPELQKSRANKNSD